MCSEANQEKLEGHRLLRQWLVGAAVGAGAADSTDHGVGWDADAEGPHAAPVADGVQRAHVGLDGRHGAHAAHGQRGQHMACSAHTSV